MANKNKDHTAGDLMAGISVLHFFSPQTAVLFRITAISLVKVLIKLNYHCIVKMIPINLQSEESLAENIPLSSKYFFFNDEHEHDEH